MKTWNLIESILAEEMQYRGDTFVSLSDIDKLFTHGPDRNQGFAPGIRPNPKGGVQSGNYRFDPTILALGDAKKGDLNAWWDELDTALARATTASAKEIGAGMGSGGTMVKGTYGNAGAGMQMAPKQPHHNDRLGSTMDRYDVILVADVDMQMNRKGIMVPVGILKRVAWAPSFGSAEERSARLQAILQGQQADVPRRPQPHRPQLSKDDERRQADMVRKAAERDAAARADAGDEEPKANLGSKGTGGSSSNQAFRDKLAKHNASYDPGPQRKHKVPDEEDALFWTPKKR